MLKETPSTLVCVYIPAGLLAGVLGTKLLGLVWTEGLTKGLPVKLLLIEELVSEALRLGFVVGLVSTGDGDLGPAIMINLFCDCKLWSGLVGLRIETNLERSDCEILEIKLQIKCNGYF